MWPVGRLLFAAAAAAVAIRYARTGTAPPPMEHGASAGGAGARGGGGPTAGSGAFFDTVAPHYDAANRLISLGLDRSWRDALVAAVVPPPRPPSAVTDDGHVGGGRRDGRPLVALDVATGTGDVALALAAHPAVGRVVGVDPSAEMLSRARVKAAAAVVAAAATTTTTTTTIPTTTTTIVADADANVDADADADADAKPLATFEAGTAEALPHPDGTFDVATVAFGVRNFASRPAGLADLARVLSPGGVLGVLEVSAPAPGPAGTAARAFVTAVVPAIGGAAGLLGAVDGAAAAVAGRAAVAERRHGAGAAAGDFDWRAFGAALSTIWTAGVADYTYLANSMMAFPGPPAFTAMLTAAGFGHVRHTRLGPWGLGPDLYVATKQGVAA